MEEGMSLLRSAKRKILEAQAALVQAKKNEAFLRLPKKEQRIAIAKDVLASLSAGELLAEHGTYLSVQDSESVFDSEEDLSASLAQTSECNVCALGALFVCGVKRANAIKVEDVGAEGGHTSNQQGMHEYLKPFFSKEQLLDIEDAFEENDHSWDAAEGKTWVGFSLGLNESDRNPKNIMRAIMLNIIRNNGTFKLNQPATLKPVSAARRRPTRRSRT